MTSTAWPRTTSRYSLPLLPGYSPGHSSRLSCPTNLLARHQPEGPSTPTEPEPETEPTPSVAGSSSVTGLPTHLRSKVAKRVPPPSASSATGTPSTASLPPHLRRRVEQQQKERLAAATATATGTGTGTNSGAGSGTVTPDGVAASLAAASLASTSSQDGSDTAVPDTAAVPNAPRQETNNNVKPFNKQWFDAYGNLTEAPGRNSPGFRTGAVLPPASPAASLDIVDEERTARAKLAQAKVGQAAAATPEQSPKPKGNWPRRVRCPRQMCDVCTLTTPPGPP